MELRLDRLLDDLRRRPAEILAAIDADPRLLKRESGRLVLANASHLLFTPQAQHQLYAKGVVYTRDPYALVSLPLIKIYNAGEREVTVADLAALAAEPGVRVAFLRKVDGSLVQVFREEGRVWFTTRGLIEGARWRLGEEAAGREAEFDYLAAARAVARERYPALLDDPALLDGRTLLFELIHPGAPKVTRYGDRADLILLAALDRGRLAYEPYARLASLAAAHGLTVVEALAPRGESLAEQVEDLLAALAGTDQEGSVLTFERGDEVIYRVKVKSPDYLRLLRLMTDCTYEATVAALDANPHVQSWAGLEALLQRQGNERVPEELLGVYRQHYEHFIDYLADLERLRGWAVAACAAIDAKLGGRDGREPAAYRKAFAAEAATYPYSGLLFAQLDGRLDTPRLRRAVRSPEEARAALAALGVET